MVFMGSKAKYADEIVPILQNIIDKNNIKLYIEPFVGGANIIDKIIKRTPKAITLHKIQIPPLINTEKH